MVDAYLGGFITAWRPRYAMYLASKNYTENALKNKDVFCN